MQNSKKFSLPPPPRVYTFATENEETDAGNIKLRGSRQPRGMNFV
jgi:hypothetical protein